MPADGWVYRVVLALSGITLVLVVVYLFLIEQTARFRPRSTSASSSSTRASSSAASTTRWSGRSPTTAVSDKDDKLRDLLAQNGITINPQTGAPGHGGASPADPRRRRAPGNDDGDRSEARREGTGCRCR